MIKSVPWKFIYQISKFPFMGIFFQKIYYSLFHYPKVLQLHINTECTHDCIYCYSNKEIEPLSTYAWMDIIDQAADLGILEMEFLGGEPFLQKDFYKLLKYTSEKNMIITIFTNGVFLDKWIDKIKNLRTQIILVIKYDYDSNLYHKITRRGDLFNKVEDNIRKCSKEGIPVVAHIVVTKYNIKYIQKIIKKSIDLGAYPFCERYIPIKDKNINQALELNKEEWATVIKIMKRVYSKVIYIPETAALLRRGICSCFMECISITPDGYALPCPFAPLELSMGNIKKMSLREIWDRYKKRREEWKRIPIVCEECEDKYTCGGGCKMYVYLKYGNFNSKDPLCNNVGPTTLGFCAFPIIHSKLYRNTKEKLALLNKYD